MFNLTVLRLILLRLGRLSRRKWLIFLGTFLIIILTGFLILDSILLVVNQFTNFYHWIDCLSGKMLARQEVCVAWEKDKIIGNLCSDWCQGSSSVIQSCPSTRSFHGGKECIFYGEWKNSEIIVKAKKLKSTNMMDVDLKLTRDEIIQGLASIVSTAFDGSENIDSSYLTIPWTGSPSKLSSLTNKELHNLWILAQDNEFIYSTFFGSLTQWNPIKLLPQLKATCGHFYAVEYIPRILQLTDIMPDKLNTRPFVASFHRRVHIATMLLTWLRDLEMSGYNLHLCDVKYDQFGITDNGSIVLIDSDMLYPREIVRESIQHIDSCIKDEDCDFIDCKGRCKPSPIGSGDICEINDDSDNNLKRFCRNLFFINEITSTTTSSQIKVGLFSHLPSSQMESDVYQLQQLCSKLWLKQSDLIATINQMIDLTAAIQSRSHL
ncbi:divergent protein kinase domain 1C-like [Panonychus citri]|uniref:divergent protein kinase domain 1C-like n=1 Tax=Panonychus citri TaxID=50023 RepID=UPI0023076340|nr:divergent protein kinase domain 1C-like [Panonychus citri]